METTRTDDDKIPWRDLTPLMAPRSVAIVGASQRGADTKLAREPRGTLRNESLLATARRPVPAGAVRAALAEKDGVMGKVKS
ncbi:MAG: hypothetical protein HYU46_02400 [Deltaproteobacteria bacterium]|nr:hypothetical protein [Deltaproteobacteria bacterium]